MCLHAHIHASTQRLAQKTYRRLCSPAQQHSYVHAYSHIHVCIVLTYTRMYCAHVQSREVIAALQRRKEFEENFTRTLRDLRKELEEVGHAEIPQLLTLGLL
jgi:hypothetical protein